MIVGTNRHEVPATETKNRILLTQNNDRVIPHQNCHHKVTLEWCREAKFASSAMQARELIPTYLRDFPYGHRTFLATLLPYYGMKRQLAALLFWVSSFCSDSLFFV